MELNERTKNALEKMRFKPTPEQMVLIYELTETDSKIMVLDAFLNNSKAFRLFLIHEDIKRPAEITYLVLELTKLQYVVSTKTKRFAVSNRTGSALYVLTELARALGMPQPMKTASSWGFFYPKN